MAMANQPPADDHVCLIGRPPIKDFLSFFSTKAEGGRGADSGALAAEWRAANDHVVALQRGEPAWADSPPVQPLPEGLRLLQERVMADPLFRRAFSLLPIAVGVVELDRLVVVQKTVNLAQVRRIKERLGPSPSAEEVFRLCLPVDQEPTPYQVRQVPGRSYVFLSESNDLRFLESAVFTSEQIQNYPAAGPVAGMVGLVVGYGPNHLNAILADGRLVLNNGSHRAYALRDLGLTHAPCVIQEVSRREELDLAGPAALHRDPDLYLKAPRPPVLKDYFDPRLHKVVRLPSRLKHVRVSFTVEEVSI